jgi:N-acetylneuraminic acid mutarotase
MKLHYFLSLALFIRPTCQDLVWEEIKVTVGSIIPSSRRDAAIAYHEDAVYVFGGKSAKNEALKDMFKLDLNTNIWKSVAQLDNSGLSERFSMVHGSKGDYFYIATGEGW